ncbi:MAG: hypothetical protein AAB316_13030 [Bacteroidota bacterium]
MKKSVCFILLLSFFLGRTFAQPTGGGGIITSNGGADPAAISIAFPPGDAVVLPNGKIQIGVAVQGTVKNLGTKNYIPTVPKPLKAQIFEKRPGVAWKLVKEENLGILSAGETEVITFTTTFIKGVESGSTAKPSQYKLVVTSVNAGVTNPDVKMSNNELVKAYPF